MLALPYIVVTISGFTCFLLWTKTPKYSFDKIMAIFVFFIGFQHLYHILLKNGIRTSFFLLRSGAFPLTFGPFLYLYFLFLSNKDQKFRYVHLLHFLPFVLLLLLEFLYGDFNTMPPPKSLDAKTILPPPKFAFSFQFYPFFIFPSVIAYSTLLVTRIMRHKENTLNYFSNITFWKELTWIYWMIGIYIISNICIPLTLLYHSILPEIFAFCEFFLLLSFIMGLSYFGLRQTIIFTHSSNTLNQQSVVANKERTNDVQKYKKSRLKEEEVSKVVINIRNYLETEKPFLDPDFTIEIMSSDLRISKHKISQCLNERMNTSFYALINEYRVEEVKLEIQRNIDDRLNFLNLAFSKGFNSKSAFNNAFKKLTGMTPSQYKNKLAA